MSVKFFAEITAVSIHGSPGNAINSRYSRLQLPHSTITAQRFPCASIAHDHRAADEGAGDADPELVELQDRADLRLG